MFTVGPNFFYTPPLVVPDPPPGGSVIGLDLAFLAQPFYVAFYGPALSEPADQAQPFFVR